MEIKQAPERTLDKMIVVSRMPDTEPDIVSHQEQGSRPQQSSWTRHAFIVTPVIMAIVSLTFFATRNLVDAHAEMVAEIRSGDSEFERLKGVGQESFKADLLIGQKEYDRIVGAAREESAQTVEAATREGNALVYEAIQKGQIPNEIAEGFTRELYGRNPEIAQMCFEIARLKVELANGIDLPGDVILEKRQDSLSVGGSWSNAGASVRRREKTERLNLLLRKRETVVQEAVDAGAKAIRSYSGRVPK